MRGSALQMSWFTLNNNNNERMIGGRGDKVYIQKRQLKNCPIWCGLVLRSTISKRRYTAKAEVLSSSVVSLLAGWWVEIGCVTIRTCTRRSQDLCFQNNNKNEPFNTALLSMVMQKSSSENKKSLNSHWSTEKYLPLCVTESNWGNSGVVGSLAWRDDC